MSKFRLGTKFLCNYLYIFFKIFEWSGDSVVGGGGSKTGVVVTLQGVGCHGLIELFTANYSNFAFTQ